MSASLQAAAEQLLAAGAVSLLSAPALLQLVASLYSAKAAADATALRSHWPAVGLWEFVLKHLRHQQQRQQQQQEQRAGKTLGGVTRATGKHAKAAAAGGADNASDSAAAALAQLLGSVQQHASSSKEVAQFADALLASRTQYHQMLAAQQQQQQQGAARLHKQRSSPSAGGSSRPTSSSSDVNATGNNSNSSSSSRTGVIKGSWGEVKLDSGKLLPDLAPDAQQMLLPAGALQLLGRMLTWPGMLPLLRWVAGGHFLVGLQDGSLGSILMDVQVGI
jgi:hypothetical protein